MEDLKIVDIEKLDKQRLVAKIADLRKSYFDFRMKKLTSGIEKPHEKKLIKRNIAKLLTVFNRKHREAR